MKRGHSRNKYHKQNFHKHARNYKRTRGFSLRKFLGIPTWIFNGIVLVILGILLLIFSWIIFVDWFNWAEGIFWGNFIGIILIIAGIFCFIAWWRNNILEHRVGFRVGKW